jgi:hypothetical protein
MFDAEKYIAQVQNRLRSCRNAQIQYSLGPKVAPEGPWDKWEAIVWRLRIQWGGNGEILQVVDAWVRKRGPVMHDFSYHFMEADGTCIFRVDTHGQQIPYESPCHIHIGSQTFESGAPELHGLSLANVNFLNMFGWVHKYLKGKKMPWE